MVHQEIEKTGSVGEPGGRASRDPWSGHTEYDRWQTSIRHVGWHDDVQQSTMTTSLQVKEYVLLNLMNIPLHMLMHLIYRCT